MRQRVTIFRKKLKRRIRTASLKTLPLLNSTEDFHSHLFSNAN